jgi:gamma-polyglutamate synthase
MPATGLIAGCLAALLAPGAAERLAARRARAAIPIRIHVNGTRGKSTITRLIHAALYHAGIPALGKATGTAARLLLPDGGEQPLRRRGRPNIREQMWLLRQAHRLRARAVVVECMAIQPLLQWTSEREMLQATIGVIANVRTDHAEVMGKTLPEIARSLGNTIPRQGLLVLGETAPAPLFQAAAQKLGTRVIQATALPRGEQQPPWMSEAFGIALAVTRELGIDDPLALAGMQRAAADPGASRTGTIKLAGRPVPFLDAGAANDPESFNRLLQDYSYDLNAGLPAASNHANTGHSINSHALVYNHRADRPERLRAFMKEAAFICTSQLIVTGDRPCLSLWCELRRSATMAKPYYVAARNLCRQLGEMQPAPARLVFCGNTRGLELQHLQQEAERG